MPVEAINNSRNIITKKPSFTGSFNPVVTLMDAIDRGGFAASFIAQDGIGMVAPRIYEGLNRNRPVDENGKKTGPLNWEFARREGIREILSGPSVFLIPLGLMSIIKKVSGTANNVHVSHIHALGEQFADYASKNIEQIADSKAFRTGYYSKVYENVLSNSVNIPDIPAKAAEFAQKHVKAEDLKASKKEANKLISEIHSEFVKLRKLTTAASNNELEVVMKVGDKEVHSNIKKLTQSLTDYTGDVFGKLSKYIQKNTNTDISGYIKQFNLKRAGTRVASNLGMWGAVVGFFMLMPKLYNLGLKHDPGLKGLEKSEPQQKDVTFTGGFSKIGETAMKEGKISKLLGSFEFNGASMPVSSVLTLLFGFTLPSRYINAKSDKERKEILVRDITSFAAILFAAKALSRGFSNVFSKISGLALNIKPADHSKGIFSKLKNYFTAGNGIEMLSSEQIVTKYSNLEGYKDGINGFFQFLKENGGDVRKVLNIDHTVKAKSEKIMQMYGNGKHLKDASFEEINNAFRLAKDSEELAKIYDMFAKPDNKFISRAKTYNSAFGFASTLVLVPAFMAWLAKYCEKMTKKAIAKEQATHYAKNDIVTKPSSISNQPTMAGFLNNSNS